MAKGKLSLKALRFTPSLIMSIPRLISGWITAKKRGEEVDSTPVVISDNENDNRYWMRRENNLPVTQEYGVQLLSLLLLNDV